MDFHPIVTSLSLSINKYLLQTYMFPALVVWLLPLWSLSDWMNASVEWHGKATKALGLSNWWECGLLLHYLLLYILDKKIDTMWGKCHLICKYQDFQQEQIQLLEKSMPYSIDRWKVGNILKQHRLVCEKLYQFSFSFLFLLNFPFLLRVLRIKRFSALKKAEEHRINFNYLNFCSLEEMGIKNEYTLKVNCIFRKVNKYWGTYQTL